MSQPEIQDLLGLFLFCLLQNAFWGLHTFWAHFGLFLSLLALHNQSKKVTTHTNFSQDSVYILIFLTGQKINKLLLIKLFKQKGA